jgi:hypothetical protein
MKSIPLRDSLRLYSFTQTEVCYLNNEGQIKRALARAATAYAAIDASLAVGTRVEENFTLRVTSNESD